MRSTAAAVLSLLLPSSTTAAFAVGINRFVSTTCVNSSRCDDGKLGFRCYDRIVNSRTGVVLSQSTSTTDAALTPEESTVLSTPSLVSEDPEENALSRSGPSMLPKPEKPPLAPPPCPKSNPDDDVFRSVRRNAPVPFQNWLRNSGILRALEDRAILLGVPSLVNEYPDAVKNFARLSTPFDLDWLDLGRGEGGGKAADAARSSTLTEVRYGDHPMQMMHLLEPKAEVVVDGVVVFVHGGAWGSGRPWMYRLAALPFLEQSLAVAVVGYRTYPDAKVYGQVEDVGRAIEVLVSKRPDLLGGDDIKGIKALIGHSTGAHISALALLERAQAQILKEKDVSVQTSAGFNYAADVPIGAYIGLSGVYNIPTHFEYETGRGVEQMSSLKPACGPDDERMIGASLQYRLERAINANGVEECSLREDTELGAGLKLEAHLPRMLFLHGEVDTTVSYTQTTEAAQLMRSAIGDSERVQCEDVVLRRVGHSDTALHLMMGGKTKDVVIDWLAKK